MIDARREVDPNCEIKNHSGNIDSGFDVSEHMQLRPRAIRQTKSMAKLVIETLWNTNRTCISARFTVSNVFTGTFNSSGIKSSQSSLVHSLFCFCRLPPRNRPESLFSHRTLPRKLNHGVYTERYEHSQLH
jgi:hypothetical protein